MRNRPDAADLLETAHDALRAEILDALSGEQRFQALMIANAMRIAAREAAAGDRPLARALARVCTLLDEPAPALADRDALERALAERGARLAAAIRDGGWDGPGQGRRALWDHLLETTRDKLRESNPKYLVGRGLE